MRYLAARLTYAVPVTIRAASRMADEKTPSAKQPVAEETGVAVMPLAVGEPLPLILTDASLTISTELQRRPHRAGLRRQPPRDSAPDVTITTLDTMCGTKDYPGTVKWSLIATLYQSFDPDATEDVLSAAVERAASRSPFEVKPYKSQPVAATNPVMVGVGDPAALRPINGDAGDAQHGRAGMVR